MGIGISLLGVALIWVLVAQIQMGDSWRIGIDEKSSSDHYLIDGHGQHRHRHFLSRRKYAAGCGKCPDVVGISRANKSDRRCVRQVLLKLHFCLAFNKNESLIVLRYLLSIEKGKMEWIL
jgi:hypothetical protein